MINFEIILNVILGIIIWKVLFIIVGNVIYKKYIKDNDIKKANKNLDDVIDEKINSK